MVSTRSDRYPIVQLKIGDEEILMGDYLESFEFEFGVDTSYSATFNLFDPEWDVLEKLLISTAPDYTAEFRFGWGPDSASASPEADLSDTQIGNVKKATPDFRAEGMAYQIVITDEGGGAPSKEAVTRGYVKEEGTGSDKTQVPMTYSEIVEDICTKLYNYEMVIEPSKPLPRNKPVVLQREQATMYFIKHVCLPNAISAVTGRGGYVMYFENKGGKQIFHFHTPEYGQPVEGKLYASYTFGKDRMGQVISFAPTDLSQVSAVLGGGDLRGKAVDAQTKDEQEVGISSSGKTTLGGNPSEVKTPSVLKLGRYRPSVSVHNLANRVKHMNFRSKEALDHYLQAQWYRYNGAMYQATAEVMGDPHVFHLAYIGFKILKSPGGLFQTAKEKNEAHWLSGVYQVQSVKHNIGAGEFTTELSLMRNSADDGTILVEGEEFSANDVAKIGELLWKKQSEPFVVEEDKAAP